MEKKTDMILRSSFNKYRMEGEVAYITLTQNKEAAVDLDSLEKLIKAGHRDKRESQGLVA